ncbi:MAG TPA: protein-disulfide reductase DsbD [Gammaproteobacteria bacterium]|nr:protein-disulfide reductase DsbD [Gammaproteobacteria bacterium]
MTLRLISLLTLLLSLFSGMTHAFEEPLPPDQAFKFSATVKDDNTIIGTWTLPDGYYLYHDKFNFSTSSSDVQLGSPIIPPGKIKDDPLFGKVETHRKQVSLQLPVTRAETGEVTVALTAGSQGCADLGICYPPYRTTVNIVLPALSAASSATAIAADPVRALSQLGDSLGLEDANEEFLNPDKAFVLTTEMGPDNTLIARWMVADGYYMYRDKFRFRLKDTTGDIKLGQTDVSRGKVKDDEYFGKIEVLYHNAEASIPLNGQPGSAAQLEMSYQGCADAGLCYPPQFKTVALNLDSSGMASTTANQPTPAQTPTQVPAQTIDQTAAQGLITPSPFHDQPFTQQDKMIQLLQGGGTWTIIGIFFLAGLALAFTPCVFPMIPILSGIIAGQGDKITTRKAFTLSLVYVLSVAVTYTIVGVIAGMSGANLTAAFQNPWILGSFATVFVALSLSMFGFYDLQMPGFIQSRLTNYSNKQQGGTLVGVAIMGLLSALIVGPCVAAPLAAALIFIAEKGSAVLGGVALFSMSIGMGVPLLIIGTGGGKLLPKAGPWMDAVKGVFGVTLLGVAVWMLERILPGEITMVLWAALLIVPAIYLGALEPIREATGGWPRFWKGVGIMMLLYGVILMLGASTGNTDPLRPFHQMSAMSSASGSTSAKHSLPFKTVKSLDDLNREVAAASAQGKTVMLDFYADWCISCKEFDKYVFSDPEVQNMLANTVVLQADVTDNDDVDKALMKHYGIIGPPTILFYDKSGTEMKRYRVVGEMTAQQFMDHLHATLK